MTYNKEEKSVNDIVLNSILSEIEGSTVKISTMTELRNNLIKNISKQDRKLFPASASSLRVVMNRIINRLRARGITVRFNRSTDRNRTRYVSLVTRNG